MTEAEEYLKLEFDGLLDWKPRIVPDAVVVLCAEEVDVSGENKERIDAGIAATQGGGQKVPLIFLGTIKHIEKLEEYLAKNQSDLRPLYPTKRLHESSWTQIRSLADYLKRNPFNKLLVLTHAYHIPRVKRYCVKYLSNCEYDFLPVGNIENQKQQVKSEIEKIIKYAEKGDLPLRV